MLTAAQGRAFRFVRISSFLSSSKTCKSNGADCQNNNGGYSCDGCLPGWTGNGYHCYDIDECLDGDSNRKVENFYSARFYCLIYTVFSISK